MVVWNVLAEKQDEVGAKMAQFPQVSHCYKRPIFVDWPYALYTMIHGHKAEACERVVQKIVQIAGDWPRKNLYSTKEYKKIRLKYFTKELDEWWTHATGDSSSRVLLTNEVSQKGVAISNIEIASSPPRNIGGFSQ